MKKETLTPAELKFLKKQLKLFFQKDKPARFSRYLCLHDEIFIEKLKKELNSDKK